MQDLALSVGDADLSALVLGTSLPQHLRQLRLSLKGMDYTPLLALSLGPNAEAGIASNAAPAGTSAAAAVVADGADVKGAESSRAGVDSSQGRGEEAQGELVQLSSGLLGGGSGLQVLAGLSGLEQLEMESKNVPLTDQVCGESRAPRIAARAVSGSREPDCSPNEGLVCMGPGSSAHQAHNPWHLQLFLTTPPALPWPLLRRWRAHGRMASPASPPSPSKAP